MHSGQGVTISIRIHCICRILVRILNCVASYGKTRGSMVVVGLTTRTGHRHPIVALHTVSITGNIIHVIHMQYSSQKNTFIMHLETVAKRRVIKTVHFSSRLDSDFLQFWTRRLRDCDNDKGMGCQKSKILWTS